MGPINKIKLPENIFYRKNSTKYSVFQIPHKNKNANMLGSISILNKKDNPRIVEMYIYTEKNNYNIGSILINFAKNISKQLGHNKNLEVIVSNDKYSKEFSPIFYREQGFTTNSK